MPRRHLDKSQCQLYFEQITRSLTLHGTEVDVNGLDLGTPYPLDWSQLRSLTYSPDKDTFQLVTDDLDHLIPQPRALCVDAGDDGLHGIEVIDALGNSRTVRLRHPLPLAEQRH